MMTSLADSDVVLVCMYVIQTLVPPAFHLLAEINVYGPEYSLSTWTVYQNIFLRFCCVWFYFRGVLTALIYRSTGAGAACFRSTALVF